MGNWTYRRPTFLRQRQRRLVAQQIPVRYAFDTGDITGSATITFGSAASLGLLSHVTGSAAVAFGSAASLGLSSGLSGSVPIVFGATGSISSLINLTGSVAIKFGQGLNPLDLVANPKGLTIKRPSFRSIDGKSLADHFNRGLPVKPDYEWEGTRKFYQDDSTT